MPTTSAELSLINDTEFLEELAQTDRAVGHTGGGPRPLHDDAYAALESGLPMKAGVPVRDAIADDEPSREAPFEPFDEPEPGTSPSTESGVPLLTVIVVLVACLTVGAASAAYVFQDSLTRITSMARANR